MSGALNNFSPLTQSVATLNKYSLLTHSAATLNQMIDSTAVCRFPVVRMVEPA